VEKRPGDILERYRAIYDRSLVCLYVHDLEGNFLDANQTALNLLGYERQDVFSMNLASFLREDQLQEAFDTLQEILRTGKQQKLSRYELRKKDGSVVWLETEGSLIYRDGAPYAVQGIAREITDRQQMEQALRQSEENFRSLAEEANDGILIAASPGRHVYVNRKVHKMLGYGPEELLGSSLQMIVHPHELERLEDRRARRLRGEDVPERYVTRLVTKGGGEIPVELSASSLVWEGQDATLVIIRDITERKKAEEELRRTLETLKESEANLRVLFDLSPQAVALTEVETGKLINVNNRFCQITKYTREEVLGRTTLEIGSYNREDRERFLRALEESGEVQGMEMDFHIRDGSRMSTLMFARKVRVSGRTYLMTIFFDLTERKQLESELRHVQKMEAVGTLSGGVAHDFNNLLMSILGNTSLMLMDVDPGGPFYDRLKVIEEEVDRGQKLTSQLLGYARKGKYEVRSIDLNRLVEETSETFERTQAQIVIRRELSPKMDPVLADQGQIRQVLLNLFFNAADAMPGGGEIQVSSSLVSREAFEAKPYQPAQERYVHLTVSDQGTGMDPEILDRIFDPFFTTRETGKGTGLGLASSYGIVKGHQGYIDVESEPGRGTTLHVYLPVSGELPSQPPPSVPIPARGAGTLLFVEDEEPVLEIATEMLVKLGYEVLQAESGQEALDIFAREKGRVDLVILDMIMPGMSGREVFSRLREIDPEVKVLLSSGYSIGYEAEELMEKGCKGFIQKPYSLADLSRIVSKALEELDSGSSPE